MQKSKYALIPFLVSYRAPLSYMLGKDNPKKDKEAGK